MSQFGDLYAQYYDLLYKDKDYEAEVEYVDSIIREFKKKAQTVLDLGCGTGRHAELFCRKGYTVYGVEQSEPMLKIAEKRRTGKEDRLFFIQSRIQNLNLNKKFDVVVSLFHVLSYQNTNEEVIKFFKVVKNHLTDNGIFIFDFWYGPAVLTEKPSVRIKRLENENIRITRIAEPLMHINRNIIEVHYSILIEDKNSNKFIEKKEIHSMRYFFDPELEFIFEMTGLKVFEKFHWLTVKEPDINSWYVVWVAGR